MYAKREATKGQQGNSAEDSVRHAKSGTIQAVKFADHRPAALARRNMQQTANHSPRTRRLNAVQRMADNRKPSDVIQRVEVKTHDKYIGMLQDVSDKALYVGTRWRPSNVLVRGIDYSGGEYASIMVHLMNNGRNTKWVSTTTSLDVAKRYAGADGFVYRCAGIASHGISANAAFAQYRGNKDEKQDLLAVNKEAGETYPFADQKEVSIMNKIDPGEITGAFTQVNGKWRYYKRGAFLTSSHTLPEEVQTRLGS